MSTSIYHDPAADDAGFYQKARLDPDRVALIAADGAVVVTYHELAARANRVAHVLRAAGLRVGDVVASLQKNGVEHYEVALAALQIGAIFVPINTHLTQPEISYLIEDSQARAIIASEELADSFADTATLPPLALRIGGAAEGWSSYSEVRDSASAEAPTDRIAGQIMCYTSGTTGKPKGVKRPMISISPEVSGLGSARYMTRFGLKPDDGVQLLFSPAYHAAPGNMTIQALQMGHTIVIQERFVAEQVLAAIEKYRVTGANAVPTQLHRLFSLPEDVKAKHDLSSLQTILVAGAPFPPKLKSAMLEWWGPVVWEYLAATEGMASIVSPAEAIARPGTVGKPADVLIVSEAGEPVPAGEVGSIYFKLDTPFEYHNDDAKTKGAMREGGYATAGDLGYLDEDGYLFLLDRRVDLIISGGVNVYPAEVEQRLAEHDAVEDVAVVGLSDDEWGQRVVAVVQLAPGFEGDDATAQELEQFCRATLTGAKVPRIFRFVDELPRTEVGKLLRRQIREQLEVGLEAAR